MAKLTFSMEDRADRFVASWFGGVALPVIYFWFAYVVLVAWPQITGRLPAQFSEIFLFPILWPFRIFLYIYPTQSKTPLDGELGFIDPLNLLMMIVGNSVLYTIISYGTLTYIQRGRRDRGGSLQLT